MRIPTVEIVTFQIEPFGPKKNAEGAQEAPQGAGASPEGSASAMPADLEDWAKSYDQA